MNRAVRLFATLAVCSACLTAPASAVPDAAPANIERLRPLDFTPFSAALDRFTSGRAKAVDGMVAKNNVIEMQAAMKQGSLSSEELTLCFLARIKQYDERLRTYLELNPRALDEARASDARRKAGTLLGPLDGIPVSLKDNIETAAPMHTTAGAEVLFNNIAAKDAALVAQLRAQGAVILGKANLSEFAGVINLGPLYGGSTAVGGQTINPHGPYPTWGSSSGSAAGVAARLAMLSVGSETSGSIIAPSSANSVVGMKPSRGRVSGEGVLPLVKANDSAGPIARTVTDVALLLDAIDNASTDYVAGLKTDALDGITVGMLNTDIVANPDNTPLLQAASGTLVALGAKLRPATLVDTPEWGTDATFMGFLAAGVRYDMMGYVAAHVSKVKSLEDLIAYNKAEPKRRMPYEQQVLDIMANYSSRTTAAEYAAQGTTLGAAARAILDATFQRTGAEVLVSFENLNSKHYATAGYPAITVPLGLRSKGGPLAPLGISSVGMPIGITFIGRGGDDARVLAFAYAFEQATQLRVAPELK